MSEELNQLNELSTTQTDHEYGGLRPVLQQHHRR